MENRSHGVSPALDNPPEVTVSDVAERVAHDTFSRFDDVNDVLQLLWSHKRFLAWNAVSGGMLFAVIALLLPVQFQSSARLMPPDQGNSTGIALLSAFSATPAGALGMASDALGLKSSGALFTGILRSRTVQDRIVERFDLRRVYGVKYWENAREKLGSRTAISEDRKSGIIEITVTDHDRQRAAAIAQTYVDELNALVSKLATSSAHRERVFLEERLKTVKQDLDSAAISFSQFASKNTTIDLGEQGKAMVESAARLQGELIAAQSELSGVEQIYSKSNIRVRSLKARIEELKRQLDKIGGSDLSEQADASSSYPSIRRLPILGVRYSDLYRTVKIEEAVYEALTKQCELAKVEEAKETPMVALLDPPNIPERKSFPPRTLIVLLGFLLGGVTAILWLVWRALWHRLDPRDPRRMIVLQLFNRSDSFRSVSSTTQRDHIFRGKDR